MASWPDIPLDSWRDTKTTLHLYTQIVGKIRLGLTPPVNHWWHVPLYVSSRGLTTSLIPANGSSFELELDLIDHHLAFRHRDGRRASIPLGDPVKEFYRRTMSLLGEHGVDVEILARPYKLSFETPFGEDEEHGAYDRQAVRRFWEALLAAERVFRTFRGRFVGKCSPIHFFWHSFDLAVTRFSGRPAPPMPEADRVTQEAYSHEVISSGFWPGDERVPFPSFYAYTAPEPAGLTDEPLRPESARWQSQGSGSLALLPYSDARRHASPEKAVLDFLQSSYEAGARRAQWDRGALERNAS